MEAILFIGIQGAGKSSFFKERFFSSHLRISLDLLKTRHRERHLVHACLDTQQPIVIDNTNPTRAERSRYIHAAKAARYTVLCYYFQSKVADCLQRNRLRSEREIVSDIAILSAAKKLELPTFEEGFSFRWRNEDAARNALNAYCYWTLRKRGLDEHAATTVNNAQPLNWEKFTQ